MLDGYQGTLARTLHEAGLPLISLLEETQREGWIRVAVMCQHVIGTSLCPPITCLPLSTCMIIVRTGGARRPQPKMLFMS